MRILKNNTIEETGQHIAPYLVWELNSSVSISYSIANYVRNPDSNWIMIDSCIGLLTTSVPVVSKDTLFILYINSLPYQMITPIR